MSAKVNNLRNLTKKDFEIIKELSLLGTHIKSYGNKGLNDSEEQALFNLLSRCGNEFLDESGNSDFEYGIDFKIIERYNELVFWEVLAKKLAARDTLEKLGDEVTEYNVDEFEKIKDFYELEYMKKFKFVKFKDAEDNISKFDSKFLPY
ncbi:MAG: hypothetical protein ACRC41_10410 [Sarcina sp.]